MLGRRATCSPAEATGHVAPGLLRVPRGQREGKGGRGIKCKQPPTFPPPEPAAAATSTEPGGGRRGTRVYLYFPSRGQESPGKHVGPEPWAGARGPPIWASRGWAGWGRRAPGGRPDPGEAGTSDRGRQRGFWLGAGRGPRGRPDTETPSRSRSGHPAWLGAPLPSGLGFLNRGTKGLGVGGQHGLPAGSCPSNRTQGAR